MSQKRPEPEKPQDERKPYVKPELRRMNEKVGRATGAPAVPGPPVSAQASPVAPGSKVF